ncbi:hypothetical protein [Vitiosangium sp. GDMCC 1.1324]|uniref:hypothetical protein n=1 Tax=Vitiosangium sp. (strain GDMCC 1.1324) TaxID=2138576 RepID=UPI000D3CD436|nr:hypothetical protein [Vitiosangium sp. GDMCC 1.1324]PTL83651.1 hypothetical protein DAT35_09200 [Vitiosangium sp. GDMCC 1.1324]
MIPAWMLYLLAPMVALAQNAPITDDRRENHLIATSPQLWFWVAALVVAAAAFAAVTINLSKHRQPPQRPNPP